VNYFACVAAGWTLGFLAAWVYFRSVRLIRTRHEWYSDPVIRARHPEEAERALSEPDGW
jgi:hypothetical protein